MKLSSVKCKPYGSPWSGEGRRYTVRSVGWGYALYDRLTDDFVWREGHARFWFIRRTRAAVWAYIRTPMPAKDEREWKLREVEEKLDRGAA
jgi:hypothetical protein